MVEILGFIAVTIFNVGCAAYCGVTRVETIRLQNDLIADLRIEKDVLRSQLASEQNYSLEMARKNYDLTHPHYKGPEQNTMHGRIDNE